MRPGQVTLQRFRATGLPTSEPGWRAETAGEQIARLGAVQAQEFEMTLWALGRRTGQTRLEIMAEFDDGRFIRTHALRPTWHAVHPDDLAMIRTATADRVLQVNASMERSLELDGALLHRCTQILAEAVSRAPRTRKELQETLARRGVIASGPRLAYVLMRAELTGVVANGPMRGAAHTYALAPRSTFSGDRSDAVAGLALRFFRSHGPATVGDLARWATLTRSDVSAALDALGDQVTTVTAGGVDYHLGSDATPAAAWRSPQVDLLNGYDEYVSGFGESKGLADRAGLARGRPGLPVGIVTVDGQLAGHWRRRSTAAGVTVDVLVLRAFSAAETSGVEQEARRLAQFLDRPVDVTINAVI